MVNDIYLTSYYLDETIDSLIIDFDGTNSGLVDEIEIPENVASMIYIKEKGNKITWCEIVNPKEFLESPNTNDVEINGLNLKKIIKEEYKTII